MFDMQDFFAGNSFSAVFPLPLTFLAFAISLKFWDRPVQLQTGCDLLFRVKTASDLPPPTLSSYLALRKNSGKKHDA
jgi:hypothetical protein